jgi:long-chain acyl-CoA synthetase
MNMGSLVTRNARHWPAGLARVCGEQRLTHRQLNHEVNRLANALLALGVNKGDRIATLLPACPELMEVQWAAAKIGAVLVPLAPGPNGDNGPWLLREARASLVVGNLATADAIAAVKPRLPIAHDRYLLTDAALTGFRDFHGLKAAATTAEPEGQPAGHRDPFVVCGSGRISPAADAFSSHAGQAFCAAQLSAMLRVTAGAASMLGCRLDPQAAFLVANAAAYSAGAIVFAPGPGSDGGCGEQIARERATLVVLSSSDVEQVLRLPVETTARLQTVAVFGGAGHEQATCLNQRVPGRWCEIHVHCSGMLTCLGQQDCLRKPGSIGLPMPFCELRVVDPNGRPLTPGEIGEISGLGPAADGVFGSGPSSRPTWLATGEMGYADEDGFIYRIARQPAGQPQTERTSNPKGAER